VSAEDVDGAPLPGSGEDAGCHEFSG
jgi:hypothetical protein